LLTSIVDPVLILVSRLVVFVTLPLLSPAIEGNKIKSVLQAKLGITEIIGARRRNGISTDSLSIMCFDSLDQKIIIFFSYDKVVNCSWSKNKSRRNLTMLMTDSKGGKRKGEWDDFERWKLSLEGSQYGVSVFVKEKVDDICLLYTKWSALLSKMP